MACYHPIGAYQKRAGGPVYFKNDGAGMPLQLPCGQCVGCKLERSRQWAVRCMHEASLYENNCFVTLTLDDDHLPSDGSLDKDIFQRFMKRLRKWCVVHMLTNDDRVSPLQVISQIRRRGRCGMVFPCGDRDCLKRCGLRIVSR
jgi:hypothetical protein